MHGGLQDATDNIHDFWMCIAENLKHENLAFYDAAVWQKQVKICLRSIISLVLITGMKPKPDLFQNIFTKNLKKSYYNLIINSIRLTESNDLQSSTQSKRSSWLRLRSPINMIAGSGYETKWPFEFRVFYQFTNIFFASYDKRVWTKVAKPFSWFRLS